MEIYLDNAATTKVSDNAISAAVYMMRECYGNAHSIHSMGYDAEKEVRGARDTIANTLYVSNSQMFFTSGATEANNIAILGGCIKNKRVGNTIITSRIEHPSVFDVFKHLNGNFNVVLLDVDSDGKINLDQLQNVLSNDVGFVSVMHTNNETGIRQPIEQIVKLVREKSPNALVHSDITQGYLKERIDLKSLDLDFASFSGHKIGAPKGVGALYVRDTTTLAPVYFGGDQENGVRSGTLNTPGIVAFGVAAGEYYAKLNENIDQLKALNEQFKNSMQSYAKGYKYNGDSDGAILSVCFENTKSEVLVHHLESRGVMVSSGAACSSNKPGFSRTLSAMGVSNKDIDGTIRVSFSKENSLIETDIAVRIIAEEVDEHRKVYRG